LRYSTETRQKEHIKAKNLLVISFYKPVQPSAAHGNDRRLTTPPSEQPKGILKPKAETGIFVTEIHTDRSTVDCSLQLNEKVPKLSGRKLVREERDEFTAARFTHSTDTAQWKYDLQKVLPRPYSYFS